MKGVNISSCASHVSTAAYSPISTSMDDPSSSSSSSLSSVTVLDGSTGGGGGTRAIDRHNPIIADERRISTSTPSTTTSSNSTPYFTPKFSPFNQQNKTQKTSKKKRNPIVSSTTNAKKLIGLSPKIKTINHAHQQLDAFPLQHTPSKPSDLITVSKDQISPPESSRYLLDDPDQEFGSGFLDRVFSDLDPPKISSPTHDDSNSSTKPPTTPKSSSAGHQVVVLRVSLHCRGCEGKVRKHISRMQGVKSFNIDFAAKKVTVVGDVTPLQVLASISKVKNAQIWTQPTKAMP